MTTLVDAAGTTLTKAALAKSAVVIPDAWMITNDVYVTDKLEGERAGKYTEKQLLWHAGQIISDAEFQAAYVAATFVSVTPASGTSAGGTNITISGTNLRGSSGVTIGGVACTNFTVVDENTITCTTGAHAVGANALVIADDAGNITAAGAYTYT